MLNFIVTPRSLRGKGTKLFEKIKARLQEWGGAYRIFLTEKKGQATEYARQLTEEGERDIVVMGGDGAMNDVLSGLTHTEECRFGIIPAGTGNDFAASAKIPSGMDALELILGTEAKPTDYLQFSDGRRSLNIAGIGMDVDILIRCERMKRVRGKIKYFFGLLASLFKFRGCQMRVEAEGKTQEHNAMIAAVCNGKQLGGGIPLCPPAQIDDGLMELVVVDYPKRSKLLGALIKLMKGKLLELPFAHRISCTEAKIFPETPCLAQYDGELYETRALETTLVRSGLNMYRG